MPPRPIARSGIGNPRGLKAAAVVAAALALGGCAQIGALDPNGGPGLLASVAPAAQPQGQVNADLQKATEYWGKEFDKDPRNPVKAVNYARNLKAMGQKVQAFQILQEAMIFNGTDRAVASEFGRLAIDFDQLGAAQKTLEIADDPMKPDWRVVSARGTVLAKQGNARDAVTFFERAMKLAPDQHSVVNNLGLALIMTGEAARGEEMLRRAAEMKANGRTQQNLVIALGAQGKHDEAQRIAALNGTDGAASANAEVMRQMVKAAPRPVAPAAAVAVQPAGDWTAKVVSLGRDRTKARTEGQTVAAVPASEGGSGISFRRSQN